jgi:hypothetical protein
MLESQAVIGDTDMRQAMQQDALRLAGKALDDFEAADSTEIARFIKKVWRPSVLVITNIEHCRSVLIQSI